MEGRHIRFAPRCIPRFGRLISGCALRIFLFRMHHIDTVVQEIPPERVLFSLTAERLAEDDDLVCVGCGGNRYRSNFD